MTAHAAGMPVRATTRAPPPLGGAVAAVGARRGRATGQDRRVAHRLLAAGTAVYPPGAVFGPRRLSEHELVWLDSGSATWQRGDQRLHLRPGDLLLVPPGAPDTFHWDPDRPTAHGYAHVVIDGQLTHPTAGAEPVLLPAGVDPVPQAACAAVLELSGRPEPTAAARLQILLVTVVGLLALGPLDPPATRQMPEPLARAIGHVGCRWAHHGPVALPLPELAAAGGVSARTLSRLAAPVLPDGLIRSLERVRLARFAVLLSRSTLTIEAAGRACGYRDPFHLSRHFRDVYGTSPSGYRALAARGGPLPDPLTGSGMRELAALVRAAESAQPPPGNSPGSARGT